MAGLAFVSPVWARGALKILTRVVRRIIRGFMLFFAYNYIRAIKVMLLLIDN